MTCTASAVLVLACIASSPSMAGGSAAASPPLLKATGIQLQSSYAAARSRLLRSAWTADATWGVSGVHEQLAFPTYPEVRCGQGYHAVCTGRFEKNGTAILVTMDPRSGKLPVTSVDED